MSETIIVGDEKATDWCEQSTVGSTDHLKFWYLCCHCLCMVDNGKS
jgi:hypothetical protein